MNDTPACWSWSVTGGHLASVASCPETFAHLLLWNWHSRPGNRSRHPEFREEWKS